MSGDFALKSVMVQEEGFYRFTFFCEMCDGGFTTGRISAPSVLEARRIAQLEARPYFNCCHKCGKWICDEHYNENVFMCTACAPRNSQKIGGKDHGE